MSRARSTNCVRATTRLGAQNKNLPELGRLFYQPEGCWHQGAYVDPDTSHQVGAAVITPSYSWTGGACDKEK
jgi:hypothetical protein